MINFHKGSAELTAQHMQDQGRDSSLADVIYKERNKIKDLREFTDQNTLIKLVDFVQNTLNCDVHFFNMMDGKDVFLNRSHHDLFFIGRDAHYDYPTAYFIITP